MGTKAFGQGARLFERYVKQLAFANDLVIMENDLTRFVNYILAVQHIAGLLEISFGIGLSAKVQTKTAVFLSKGFLSVWCRASKYLTVGNMKIPILGGVDLYKYLETYHCQDRKEERDWNEAFVAN